MFRPLFSCLFHTYEDNRAYQLKASIKRHQAEVWGGGTKGPLLLVPLTAGTKEECFQANSEGSSSQDYQ